MEAAEAGKKISRVRTHERVCFSRFSRSADYLCKLMVASCGSARVKSINSS